MAHVVAQIVAHTVAHLPPYREERTSRATACPSEEKVPRGFEPRSLDSESGVLTVTPQDHVPS